MIKIATKKLYLQDSYIREFSAKIIEQGIRNNQNYVVLDQTAFYPEGGGQPWDKGTIDNVKVTKVLEEEGIVYHYTEEEVKATSIKGSIDWLRRFDHMQQHLGQHILSGAFEQVLDGETVGFHLGDEYVTVDIAVSSIGNDQLNKVEDLANEIIQRNVMVKTYIVNKDEVQKIPMRKPPKVDEDIRIIEVDSTDYSGCGGTHPNFTGEVGIVKITKVEKNRGNVRVEFLCGSRAIRDYRLKNSIVLDSSSFLSRSYLELKEGIMSLQQEAKELARDNKLLKQALNEYRAKEYYLTAKEHNGTKIVSEVFSHNDFSDLISLAGSVASEKGFVVLFANKGDKAQIIFTCSKDVDADMNELLKSILPAINGTGGGNKFRAQGGAQSTDGLEEAIQKAFDILVGKN